MELMFYGVRGSYPTSRKDQVSYGGNTTCFHFRSDAGQDLVMDAGSGIRKLGHRMMGREFGKGQGHLPIIIGHTHWDHIMGLPFFHPMYIDGNEFTFVSAGQTDQGIRDILSGQYRDLHFPVALEHIPAKVEFEDFAPGDKFELNGFQISSIQLNHQGITVGYRIEADGNSAVIFTDTARITEVRLGDGMGGTDPDKGYADRFTAGLREFCADADVVVHDSHFFEHEMVGKYHWGHSTLEDAIDLCKVAQVKNLFLFHHAPEHWDIQVDAKLALARDLSRKESFNIFAAAEGWKLDVAPETNYWLEATS